MEEKTTVKTENKADNKENKKENIKEQNKKETDKVKKADAAVIEDEEDEEDNDNLTTQELFNHRTSIALTPENAWFSKSEGGLTSLKIINDLNEEEFFERVVLLRSFPLTSPDEFISVRNPDTKENSRSGEIGMIRNINIFDKETIDIINEDLAVRYFTPELKKITYAKEKFGYVYWDVETSAGNMSIVICNPFGSINILPDGRIMVWDVDGSQFMIPDVKKLDKRSYKHIEIYL